MPSKGSYAGVSHQQIVNGVTYVHAVPDVVGTVQSISALNNAGRWQPGVFRANPVVILKRTGTSSGGGNGRSVEYAGNKGRIEGHLHVLIAQAAKFTPGSSNMDFYTTWDGVAASHSLQKALAKMNEADLDLGLMLGELRETISGLAKPLSALRKYVELYHKLSRLGKRPKSTDTLDMLSGSWLEWRYGVCPLISDIQAIIEHIKAQSRAIDGKLLRKRGKVELPVKRAAHTASSYPGYFHLQGKVDVTVTTKYVSKVFYRLVEPLSFNDQYGIGWDSLPSIAWELTPLSFVWDWFFSVGSWLKSVQTSNAREFVGSVTSQKTTVEAVSSLSSVKFFGQVLVQFSGGSFHSKVERLDRRVNHTVAISPLLNRGVLSVKQQVDAMSLIWQRMPKLRR